MSLVHLHLILNHVPVIGIAMAILLIMYGMLRRSDDVVRAALTGIVALALLAIPVYLTGGPAERAIQGHPGTAPAAIEVHEDAAGIALAGVELVGVIALALLIIYRRRSLPATVVTPMLALVVVLGGLMAWTANLGGKIHHTEITGGTVAPAALEHED